MKSWAIGWRVLLITVLVLTAFAVPDFLGVDQWVGLVAGFVIGFGLFIALGLGNPTRPTN